MPTRPQSAAARANHVRKLHCWLLHRNCWKQGLLALSCGACNDVEIVLIVHNRANFRRSWVSLRARLVKKARTKMSLARTAASLVEQVMNALYSVAKTL